MHCLTVIFGMMNSCILDLAKTAYCISRDKTVSSVEVLCSETEATGRVANACRSCIWYQLVPGDMPQRVTFTVYKDVDAQGRLSTAGVKFSKLDTDNHVHILTFDTVFANRVAGLSAIESVNKCVGGDIPINACAYEKTLLDENGHTYIWKRINIAGNIVLEKPIEAASDTAATPAEPDVCEKVYEDRVPTAENIHVHEELTALVKAIETGTVAADIVSEACTVQEAEPAVETQAQVVESDTVVAAAPEMHIVFVVQLNSVNERYVAFGYTDNMVATLRELKYGNHMYVFVRNMVESEHAEEIVESLRSKYAYCALPDSRWYNMADTWNVFDRTFREVCGEHQ